MNRTRLLTVLLSIIAYTVSGGELRKSGDCTIQEGLRTDKDKVVSVKLQNDDIQAHCKIHAGKFIQDKLLCDALYALPMITNLS